MTGCSDHGQKGDRDGYGRCRYKGSNNFFLHRKVFYERHGHLPPVVRHTCDNPRCVNPEHLLPGTNSDNVQDRVDRGRNLKAQPALRSLTEEQVRIIRQRGALRQGARDRVNGPSAIARDLNVSVSAVSGVLIGKNYKESHEVS